MRARWLGRVPYREAWAVQRAVTRTGTDDLLLLVEHDHTFTLGTHADRGHVLVDPIGVGADLVQVDRGGDVTYHGPGQLVGYPLVALGPGLHRGVEHVRRVEDVVIAALVSLGLAPSTVGRLDGYPGVWVGLDEGGDTGPGPRKIAAVGVRVARGRATHGFALNVGCDLAWFRHIVPCGIPDRPVTSLVAEGFEVDVEAAAAAVVAAAGAVWGRITDVQWVTGGARQRGQGVRPPAGLPPAVPGPGDGGPPRGVVPVVLGPRRTPPALSRRMARAGLDPDAAPAVPRRKPPWLRVRATMGSRFLDLHHDLRRHGLVTVCEEAGCPNIYECWADGTATFMINGSRCTRACAFCQVDTAHPLPLDPEEPERVAEAVADLGLAHAVVTCVARDDLPDGGAAAFAATIAAIRRKTPRTAVEVLVSDLKGDEDALTVVLEARPDVLNHNLETVARLQRTVRPRAGYGRSLAVLARSAEAGVTTKSGLILGMGETAEEVEGALADLRSVGVEIVTLGQYLRPSARHLPVARYWTPEEFHRIGEIGGAMGFAHVQSSPLTRSSYHARTAAEAAGSPPVTPPLDDPTDALTVPSSRG